MKDNIIHIEPQDYVGADTNLALLGRGHTYLFYVRFDGHNSNKIPDLGIKIRTHPPKNVKNGKALKNKELLNFDYLEAVITSPEDLNFNYSMSGNKEIAPNRVYSDGYRTWLNYDQSIKKRNLPSVYAVIDGVDTPVNTTRIKNSIVIQGSGVFTLKNGHKVTCIYPTKMSDAKN